MREILFRGKRTDTSVEVIGNIYDNTELLKGGIENG